MKWIRILKISLLVILSANTVRAQEESASVRLHLVLNPILNLTVHPEQASTTLVYSTLEDYKDGVEVINREHLTVSSTGPYVVSVRLASQEYLQVSGDRQKTMILPNIKISAFPIDQSAPLQLNTSMLTAQSSSFIMGDYPVLNKAFDISYQGPGGDAFLDFVTQRGSSSFTNTVIYTIETR